MEKIGYQEMSKGQWIPSKRVKFFGLIIDKAGLSLAQIRAIGGWDSKAVMLYLRSVGTAKLQFSRKMGFAS